LAKQSVGLARPAVAPSAGPSQQENGDEWNSNPERDTAVCARRNRRRNASNAIGNHMGMLKMIKSLIGTVNTVVVASALLAGAMLVTLAACEQQGPAETAGEKIDNAVEKAGEQMERTGDSIRDATKPVNN
jgi:predicted small lipoprotein YifL